MQIDPRWKNCVGGNGGVKRGEKTEISLVLTCMASTSSRLEVLIVFVMPSVPLKDELE